MGGERRLPMFPLSTVLFPGAELPLHVFEPRYRALVADCLAGDGDFGVVLIARGSEVGGGDERFGVGTLAHLEVARPFDDGRYAVLAQGRHRIAVTRWVTDEPYPTAEVEPCPDGAVGDDEPGFGRATAAVRRARVLLSELGASAAVPADLAGAPTEAGSHPAGTPPQAAARLWRLCDLAPLTPLDRQRLLETDDGPARLALLAELCEARADDLARLLRTAGPGTPLSGAPSTAGGRRSV